MAIDEPKLKISLIDGYANSYTESLSVIDNEVKDLIQNGQEMESLQLYYSSMSKIVEIHKALTILYSMIYKNQEVLKHYGSNRLKQVGHELKPIHGLIHKPGAAQEEMDNYILKGIREMGVYKLHWAFNPCFITELEYMIKMLRILIEPEFFLNISPKEECMEEKADI